MTDILTKYDSPPPVKKCDALISDAEGNPVPCTRDALWYPVFLLRQKKCKVAVKAILPIHFCDNCRAGVRLTHLLTEDGWQTIIQAFLRNQKQPPKHSLTELSFTRIGSPEAHELLHSIS